MRSKYKLFSIAATALLMLITSCASTPKGETPQELIYANRYDDAKELFVSRKLLDSQDKKGNTPLHVAAITNGAEDMVSFLLDLKADYTILNNDGNTALHEALKNKNYKAAKLLAETGNALFLPDVNGVTPIDYVVLNSNDQALVSSIISEKRW